jgi:signal transduction protein with GAF and PtsI domain
MKRGPEQLCQRQANLKRSPAQQGTVQGHQQILEERFPRLCTNDQDAAWSLAHHFIRRPTQKRSPDAGVSLVSQQQEVTALLLDIAHDHLALVTARDGRRHSHTTLLGQLSQRSLNVPIVGEGCRVFSAALFMRRDVAGQRFLNGEEMQVGLHQRR